MDLPRIDGEVRSRLRRRFGDAVEPWLEGLPGRMATLADRWELQFGEVIPHGSMSVVVRCRAREDRPAVLKLSPDTQRLAGEAAALAHWSGAHAPRVLDADTNLGALLLEEITPGTTLRQSGYYPRVDDLASLLRGLHGKDPPPQAFPDLSQRITNLFTSWQRPRQRDPRLVELVPSRLLDRGERLAHRLAQTSSARVLLHGDLTPVNILDAGEDRGLVAIDPAPCIGDPAFDAIDLLVWQAQTLEAIRQRTNELAPAMGVDPARLLSWCAAFAAMAVMDVAELPGSSEQQIRSLLELAQQVPAAS